MKAQLRTATPERPQTGPGSEIAKPSTTTVKKLKYTVLAALTGLVLAVTPSFATSINVYGTGAGQGDNGQIDNHYILYSAPTGAGPAYTTPDYPGWVAAPSGTHWINPYSSIGAAPQGYYDYQTTFDLTGLDPSTAMLMGKWAADNAGDIYLNGSLATGTGISIPGYYGFKQLTDFTVTGGFVSGVNTLDFVIFNDANVTGFVADVSGTASGGETPEPGTLTLFGTGILGLGGLLRRRLRA